MLSKPIATNARQNSQPRQVLVIAPITSLRTAQALLNIEQIKLPVYFSFVVLVVLFIGWWCLFKSRRALPEWYVLFYMALMSFWADQGPRYLMPLVPLFFIYGIVGVKWLAERAARAGLKARMLKVNLRWQES